MQKLLPKQLEELESKYLHTLYHILSSSVDDILKGFNSKEKIRKDWEGEWNSIDKKSKISDFARGAERIIYNILHGRNIGEPNSAPVGSDLFFELPNQGFIHIDLKTVQSPNNIGDYSRNIFVGDNQNSFIGDITVTRGKNKGKIRPYKGSLPTYYRVENNKFPCLTYFITILYDVKSLETICINVICLPNGELGEYYPNIFVPGKNPGKVRLDYEKVMHFKLLERKKRIKIIYFNDKFLDKNPVIKKKLKLLTQINLEQ